METNDERRRRKLGELCLAHGKDKVAEKADLSPAALDQIIKGVELPPKKGGGLRSKRGLGDSAARAIEDAFQLGRGWFDNDEGVVDMTSKELQLLGLFRDLEPMLQTIFLENIQEAVAQQTRMRESMRLAIPKAQKDEKHQGT